MESLVIALNNTASATSVSFDYPIWILFSLFVAVALALDLGLLKKGSLLFKNKSNKIFDKDIEKKRIQIL
jgi:hypothetical protein